MLTFLMNNRSVLQLPTFGAHIYILLLITSKDLYRKKAFILHINEYITFLLWHNQVPLVLMQTGWSAYTDQGEQRAIMHNMSWGKKQFKAYCYLSVNLFEKHFWQHPTSWCTNVLFSENVFFISVCLGTI